MYNRAAAIAWAVDMCNRSDIGYSQTYRNYRTVGGITYFDCSSFLFFALWLGGRLDVGQFGYSTNLADYQDGSANAWVVSTMVDCLRRIGWRQIPSSEPTQWQPGDILVKTRTHSEMFYSQSQFECMGARNNSLPLAEQVSIHSAPTTYFDQVWRDPDTTYDWIVRRYYDAGGQYLSTAEQKNNAIVCWYRLAVHSVSLLSVCAMLGCFQAESTINPGAENLQESPSFRGIGLAQWTGSRHTALENYCNAQGLSTWADGNAQIEFLWEELSTYTFSINSPYAQAEIPANYRYSNGFQFAVNSDEAFTLRARTAWWLCAFEMGGGGTITQTQWELWFPTRYQNALDWYNYLSGISPRVHGPMPAWLLKRAIENGGWYK